MTCARLPSSPEPAVAAPLEDENLLPEILLRLAPLPSSLPRASLVCSRWRHLVSDRHFIRRFRAHHRRNPPPLLGFFEEITRTVTPTPGAHTRIYLNPILDRPNRVPVKRFSTHFNDGDIRSNLGCRDGLVLMTNTARHDTEVVVWDPVTGDRRLFDVPPGMDDRVSTEILNGAVLRTGRVHDDLPPFRFQVVMVRIDRKNNRFFACVYSSEKGNWGDPVWASLDDDTRTMISVCVSSTLVGNSLYWTLHCQKDGILEFDLDRQHLSVILLTKFRDGRRYFRAMPAEGGELGILELLHFNIQLWKRKIDRDAAVVSWVLTKTIDLDQLLSLDKNKMIPFIMGYCEDNDVVFIWTVLGSFMLELQSLKIEKSPIKWSYSSVHPFTSVYIPDMGIVGGRDGAKLLHRE